MYFLNSLWDVMVFDVAAFESEPCVRLILEGLLGYFNGKKEEKRLKYFDNIYFEVTFG